MLSGGRLQLVDMPSLFGLLRHPREGLILFDTGYAPRVGACGVAGLLYRSVAPFSVDAQKSAAGRLRSLGFDPAAVRHLVLSHLHPDHIGGVLDFPNAALHLHPGAWARARASRGPRRWMRAWFPSLLPEDFERRVRWVAPSVAAGFEGVDLFGDGSLRLVALPGHADGQLGALATLADGRRVLFAADACWSSQGFKERRPSSGLMRLVVDDRVAERRTLERLYALHQDDPELWIVPAHCPRIEEMELTCD